MPLSEQEQRLLNEMERNFYSNDADFVSPIGSSQGRPSYRNIVIGVIVVLLGVAGLVVGVVLSSLILGIVAFLIMFGGVLLALTPSKSARAGASGDSDGPELPSQDRSQSGARSSGTFMDRMNSRWDSRNEG